MRVEMTMEEYERFLKYKVRAKELGKLKKEIDDNIEVKRTPRLDLPQGSTSGNKYKTDIRINKNFILSLADIDETKHSDIYTTIEIVDENFFKKGGKQ